MSVGDPKPNNRSGFNIYKDISNILREIRRLKRKIPRIDAGTGTVACVANTVVSNTINFNVGFDTAPIVVAVTDTQNPQSRTLGIHNITTTSFDVYMWSTSTGSVNFYWQAYDPA